MRKKEDKDILAEEKVKKEHYDSSNSVLSGAFTWLFVGLLICFGVSYLCTISPRAVYNIYTLFGTYTCFIYLVAEIVIALVLVTRITKLSPAMAQVLYISYSALTGLSLTGLAYVYTESSIAIIFLITALLFGVFALIGKTTKVNLSKWYTYLALGLFAIIILEIVNIFIMNSSLNMILCIASVVIFCAYTAYDVQKAVDKTFLEGCKNKGIYIAFQLFLDFVNLFLDLLELFGKEKN